MLQALYSSVDGIQAQQTRMDVIGNDLANINTNGFKSQDVQFSDLISQQWAGATAPTKTDGGTNPLEYGLGVSVGATTSNMSQGTLAATSNPSDMAIEGNGYFMVSNGTATSYTRDGSFDLDSAGNLVSTDTGQQLLGWTANADGTVDSSQPVTSASTLSIPIGELDTAQSTSTASVAGNLDPTSTTAQTVTSTFYDSLGASHDVTFSFTPPTAGSTSWTWNATEDGGTASIGAGTVTLSATGQESAMTTTTPLTLTGGTTPITVDMTGVTGLSGASSLDVPTQNGYPAGTLSSYQIGTNGTITGEFTNGLTKTLGQVALASFTNPAGLSSEGSNLFTTSPNSGPAVVGAPNTNSYGSINSGYLEQSNVDLSSSLTNLIVTQRGFEANTKMVTTVDTMLQDVIEMKH
jgi:flagellar hook protein FlgE